MTKVVAFGAFVEILPGVEGLVHISELAEHHVESPGRGRPARRRAQGQDPRDRRGAPPPLAQRQAGRGPEAAASRHLRGAPEEARGRRRGRGRRGSACARGGSRGRRRPRPRRAEAEAPAEAAAEPRTPPTTDARRGAARGRAPAEAEPRSRAGEEPRRGSPRRGARCRGAARGRARRRGAPAEAATSRPRGDRRPSRALDSLHRPHRRHRGGKVRGAGGLRATRRRDDLDRRGRPRAARRRRGAAAAGGALGRGGRSRAARSTATGSPRSSSPTPSELAWLESRSTRASARRSLEWRAGARPRDRGGRGRGAAPVRGGDGGGFDATVAVVADDGIRERAARPSAATPGSRAARSAS